MASGRQSIIRRLTIIVSAIFLSPAILQDYCQAHTQEKSNVTPRHYNILILHSYHEPFQWTADINGAIAYEIKKHDNIHSFSEYMDTKRIESDQYLESLKELYRIKYTKGFFDAIICSDNSALEFIINWGRQIWGDIPVVFCGVNNAESYRDQVDTTFISGVAEDIDIKSNIKFAQRINPQLNEIIFVTDSTLTGSVLMTEASSIESSLAIQFLYIDNAQDFDRKIHSIDFTNKAVYVLSLFSKTNRISNELSKEYIYHLNKLNTLIFGPWDFLLNDLAIGGRIIRAQDQGSTAARLMIRKLLQDDKSIPFITPSTYKWMGDEKKCIEKNIPLSVFPSETLWVNKKLNWIERNESILLFALGGLTVGFLITALFISIIRKKRKAELQQKETEIRLEMALAAANAGLWDVSYSKKEFFVSDKFASLLGYNSVKELNPVFGNWSQNIYPDDLQKVVDTFDQLKQGQSSTLSMEIRLTTSSGEPVWFIVFGKITTQDANNEIERISGLIINISKRKQIEEQLRLAKEKAEMSDKLKTSFLANMSHEIRTPMNAIVGFSDLLIDCENLDEEQRQYLQIIKDSGDSLLNLINDIIDLSKIESGYMTIEVERFCLAKITDSLNAVINRQIKNWEKAVEFRISSNIPINEIELDSDPNRLKQILLNLCTNSVKFTDKGYIELNINKYHNRIDFTVIDTGIGIPEEAYHIIFDRFRQVDDSRKRYIGGTGLGLSITQSLTNIMGGSINFISQVGKGTTFMVVLPLPTPSQPKNIGFKK